MAKYLLAYHGGSMPESPEEQATVMEAWGAWYGSLGAAVVDPGMPTGSAVSIAPDGSISDGGGANPVSGWTIVEAGDLTSAVGMAKTNPLLSGGGSIEVCEAIDMM